MFGQALFAISNISGSGRKLTLRSFEISVRSVLGSNETTNKAILYKCGSVYGEDMTYKSLRFDSTYSIPATLKVYRGGGADTYANGIRSYDMQGAGAAAGTQNTLNNQRAWSKFGGLYQSGQRASSSVLEPLTVRQNEAYSLSNSISNSSRPVRLQAVVSIDGHTCTWEWVTSPMPGHQLFAISNTGTNVVKILKIGVSEVGTTDTPYLRMVKIGQIYGIDSGDTTRQMQSKIMPMNSTYPSLTSVCTISTDVGFIPDGVPENYMTDTTAGSPRGFNYLHTKDFNGPCLRVFFPEMCNQKPGNNSQDMLGQCYSHLAEDIGVIKSGITINPGEGIAIVGSAETAVGVQAAFSGWPSLIFSATIDSEPQFSPYLNLTGLQTGSDIVILSPGTTTILASVDANSGSTYSLNYDPDLFTVIDLCVYKNGYVPFIIRNLNLGTAGATVPVSQIIDKVFV